MMKHYKKFLIALLLAWLPLSSQAEQFQDFGDYVVHFNAIPTSFLNPDVAKNYRITRSKHRAMLNITVLRKVMGTAGTPLKATVKATATNLSDQVKDMNLKEIREGAAIYYVGQVRVTNDETLNFNIEVTPDGEKAPLIVRFRQRFFTD